jgi:hypothetical protein
MVKCCKRLENVLTRLAQKHGVDVNAEEGTALSFRLPGFSDFVVEFQGRLVCVAHYHEQEGDQIPDPEVWLTRTDEGWVPLSMHQMDRGALALRPGDQAGGGGHRPAQARGGHRLL